MYSINRISIVLVILVFNIDRISILLVVLYEIIGGTISLFYEFMITL